MMHGPINIQLRKENEEYWVAGIYPSGEGFFFFCKMKNFIKNEETKQVLQMDYQIHQPTWIVFRSLNIIIFFFLESVQEGLLMPAFVKARRVTLA